MSALPAEVTELPATPVAVPPDPHVASPAPVALATPTLVAPPLVPVAMPAPFAVRPPAIGSPPRAEIRAAQALARRVRRRWSIIGLAILGCSFGLTVGLLDVLH